LNGAGESPAPEPDRKKELSMSRYRVRQQDIEPYSPANHVGTRNYRMIGAETVGAKQVEMLIGEVEKGKGALAHAHPGIEQVCYLLEGTAQVEVAGEAFELAPGEACFFPPDAPHVFTVTSERAKVMVIYAPPYGEDPARSVRDR
jgi:quercetin dioxygenase-like cupin family protein